jgi:hypothetical protein
MMTPYQNNNSRMIVFSSILLTMAMVACDQLENAGLTAVVLNDSSGYIVVVPAERAEQSAYLLEAEPHYGEIYLYQK